MATIGSENNPVVFRKAIVSKESRFRKGFDRAKYQENYDKIFNKSSDQKNDRALSKTFSTEQDS